MKLINKRLQNIEGYYEWKNEVKSELGFSIMEAGLYEGNDGYIYLNYIELGK